ncbi:MAG: uroporphyrinogen decarboxylase [Propionibacteriaceae bacterium]|nr:uroporphyrinogen decarboxylase [Propionibacteriaceae bacterium]
MVSTALRLGTRGSLLATTQASQVGRELEALSGMPSELVTIKVEGDDHSLPLGAASRPGIFTSALRDALLDRQVDYVVHSFKDLPSAPCPGLVLAAVPVRADPFDVLAGTTLGLAELELGARVGTSSPRRTAGIARLRPDIEVVPLRGNVETRLRKVSSENLAGVVMAVAGLDRAGLLDPSWKVFDPDQLLPAPAQGALAIECCEDSPLLAALSLLDHVPSRLAALAERAVLAGVEASCVTAVGAHATWVGTTLRLVAELSDHRSVKYAKEEASVDMSEGGSSEETKAEALGHQVAQALLAHSQQSIQVRESGCCQGCSKPDLIRAYKGRRTAHRPVWFMRQAGRSLPEYRAAREGIAMLESCLTPDLAAEITCQPVRRHKVDAAIFFSDIMVPAKLAGVEVEIVAGRGPVLAHPIRTAGDVAALPELDPSALAVITQGVQASVAQLGSTPLIGFAGAPFTVASYLVEGAPSRSFTYTKALMAEDPETWQRLAMWVARTTQAFLEAQIDAGAQAIQLFDSWVGALSVDEYERLAGPYSKVVFDGIAAHAPVPRVHFGTGTAHLLASMYAAGATVMGVDAQTRLDDAEADLGGNVPLQGNIDPALLAGPWEDLEAHVREVLAAGQAAPGHVVNLGHGVPATTDPDRLTQLVELIHSIPDMDAERRNS